MAKQKTRAELEAELRFLRRERASRDIASAVNAGIRWGGVVLIARYGYLSIDALAGHQTAANIIVNFLGNFHVSEGLAWLLTAGGATYGLGQNRLRKRIVEHLHGRIRELEERVDPQRSSSNLTPSGDTRPEDEP